MRVQWAVLARFAEVQNGSLNVMGAGVDTFFVPDVPATIQAFVAVQFRLLEPELDDPPAAHFIVKDGRLDQVGEAITFQPPSGLSPSEHHPPGWEVGIPIAGPFQGEVDDEGTYSLDIEIGGTQEWTLPFRVQVVGGAD